MESAKRMAAWTFGSMEPGAKWPSAQYCAASAEEMLSSHFCSGLPKLMAAFSTAVRMMR